MNDDKKVRQVIAAIEGTYVELHEPTLVCKGQHLSINLVDDRTATADPPRDGVINGVYINTAFQITGFLYADE